MTYTLTIHNRGAIERQSAYSLVEARELALTLASIVEGPITVRDEHGRPVASCRLCGVLACRNHAQA